MDIRSEPDIGREVPAQVIRVFINDDLVRIPEPVGAEANIGRSNAEVELTKPESRRAASRQPERVL
jgi:hypothetical protein